MPKTTKTKRTPKPLHPATIAARKLVDTWHDAETDRDLGMIEIMSTVDWNIRIEQEVADEDIAERDLYRRVYDATKNNTLANEIASKAREAFAS